MEKETSPLHGWIIAFMGGKWWLGKPVGLPLEIAGPTFLDRVVKLDPTFEIVTSREPMVMNTAKGPVPTMVNARTLTYPALFEELHEQLLPAGTLVSPARLLSGKNRQELANVVGQMEDQRRANKAGVLLASAH